jgi:hypothetical protein
LGIGDGVLRLELNLLQDEVAVDQPLNGLIA